MAITSLSQVTNNYGTYQGNSIFGKRGSVATVPNDGLEAIRGVNYPFLSGIIVEIGGVSYTDSGYLNALKLAGNPYISLSTLPRVTLSLSDLTAEVPDTIVYDDVTRTTYSESNVTKRMSTVNDILFYLNDFFNPNTSDTVLSPQAIGGFSLSTTTYSSELDVIGEYPGLQFETFENINEATTIKISTPPTVTTPKEPEPKPVVKTEPVKQIKVTKPPKPSVEVKTSTGIKINTPTGTFTGIDQNFLLGDANKNTGNADVRDTIRQLSTSDGLDRTGLRTAYDSGDLGPMAAMFDDGNYDSFGMFG